MDIEAFVSWAMDDARTLEERFTVELMIPQGLRQWHWKRKNYDTEPYEESHRRSREQTLNPAYEPTYSETDLRRASESIAEWKQWNIHTDRPVRDISALAFLTQLEAVDVGLHSDVVDLTPLTVLPKLETLKMGYPGSLHGQKTCEDYTALARCTGLTSLTLSFATDWPDLTGIDALTELTHLQLTGNLMALPRGISFPKVHHASLYCMPLGMRDMRELPELPACEFLVLHGCGTFQGIEKMPRLRNLRLHGHFKSYEALTVLKNLTCLTVEPDKSNDPHEHPSDLMPINRISSLLFYQYGRGFVGYDYPNDYSQLTDSPSLREILIQGCPHVDMEVASVNAGLSGWEDLCVLDVLKPIPEQALFVIAPDKAFESDPGPEDPAEEWTLPDLGVIACQSRWVVRHLQSCINEQIGHSDWGYVEGTGRQLNIHVESYEVIERLPEILEAARQTLSRLRHRYVANFWIFLKVPPPEPSPAMKALEAELRKRRDEWDSENRHREQQEYIRQLHRKQLLEQEGSVINPEEFSPEEQPPYPQMEDLLDEMEMKRDQDEEDYQSDLALKTEYKKPAAFEDEHEHPLADAYKLIGQLHLDSVVFRPFNRGIAIHLMNREPDIDIPDPEKKEA